MADITRAKVFRYNPGVDSKPSYKTYEVPWFEFMSVLELLKYIQENIEPVSFDYCCRIANCGQCSLQVNGKPVLGCSTVVPKGDILIEPLAGFRVIRDLIVDRTEVENRLYGTMPWFSRTTPLTEMVAMPGGSFLKTVTLQQCKSCLCCQAICPVLKEKGFQAFAGPYILTWVAARYSDTREDFADQRLKTAVREGLFQCILCGLCDDVCPRGKLLDTPGYEDCFINHVKTFKEMMDAAKAKGWAPST